MDGDWRDRAACNGMDTDLWFPVAQTPKRAEDLKRIRIAKNTCAACPVRLECLAYAFRTGQRFGIWGGMSERDRRTQKGRRLGRELVTV